MLQDTLPESSEPGTSTKHKSKTPSDQKSKKRRKYLEELIKYRFTCSTVSNAAYPQCVICLQVPAHESMKPFGDKTWKTFFAKKKRNYRVKKT